MFSNTQETTEFLLKKTGTKAKVGIILGTGLGQFANEIVASHSIPYSNIPHFPVSTVESHVGRLIFGTLNGTEVIAMQGRFHYYEGYSMQQITFPVVVMKQLGITHLIVSNASGGLNPAFKISDLMVLNDHLNLLPDHPLRGKYRPILGPRFPEMSEPYDHALINKAMNIASEAGITLHQGVYAAVMGPSLETPAEYRYLRTIGADAVGMSTVPEVIVARSMGLKVFAISAITDEAFPEVPVTVTLESVVAAANKAEPQMTFLIKQLIQGIA